MLFALNCLDKPGSLPIRLENRPAHLDYLNGSGSVVFAGPYIEADKPVGSLVVIEVADRAAAEAFAAADPYAKAGLFETVTLREWRKVIG
ncbi:MAG: YciI family protein [Gemmobacter sp.]|nr:YciI family protein [Gemmobacter sp.]